MSATATTPELITPKQAATAALDYFRELTDATGVFVEEVELEQLQGLWYVTLSHDIPGVSVAFRGMGSHRDYKLLTVDAHTGRVVGMKIHKVS